MVLGSGLGFEGGGHPLRAERRDPLSRLWRGSPRTSDDVVLSLVGLLQLLLALALLHPQGFDGFG